MRIVLDTDVLVAALRSDRGASRQLLMAALDHRVQMLASVALMLEYEAVLTRPKQLREIGATSDEITGLLKYLAGIVEQVVVRFQWRPQLRDPGDEMVLEAALNGGADCLATFNLRHFGSAATAFGIRIAQPGVIWREIVERRDEKK